jgi:hypothetical protein
MPSSLKNKKILALIIGAILILIFLAVLFFLTRGNGENAPTNTATNSDGSAFGAPSGNNSQVTTGGNQNPTTENNAGATSTAPHAALFQITTTPVVGFTTFASAGVTFVRYIDRATGHIFESGLQNVNGTMVSNVTIPRVENAEWKGDSILLQYTGEDAVSIRSFLGSFQKNTDPDGLADTITGFFIDDNSLGAALRPDGGAVFSLYPSPSGSSGVMVDTSSRARSTIFSSPLSEFHVEWPEANTIALTTKPDQNAMGILFFLNPTSHAVSQILDGVDLTTRVNSNATKVAYTSINNSKDLNNNSLTFSLFNVASGASKSLSLITLPEKCVWSHLNTSILYCFVPRTVPNGNDQMLWYQGVASFSDNLWIFNTDTGETNLLSVPIIDARISIDAIDPMLSNDEHYLLFKNKTDGNLFGFRLPAGDVEIAAPSTASTTAATTTSQ